MPHLLLSKNITFGGPVRPGDPALPTGSELNDRVLAWLRTGSVWSIAVHLGTLEARTLDRTTKEIGGVIIFAYVYRDGGWQPGGAEAFSYHEMSGVVPGVRTQMILQSLSQMTGEVSYTPEEWAKVGPRAKLMVDRLRFLCIKHQNAHGTEILDAIKEGGESVKTLDDEIAGTTN